MFKGKTDEREEMVLRRSYLAPSGYRVETRVWARGRRKIRAGANATVRVRTLRSCGPGDVVVIPLVF